MRIFTMITAGALAGAGVLSPAATFAQDDAPEATAEQVRPAATLADMAWLAGSWTGPAIGGNPAGETFTYAGDQQMVGHFWQLDDEGGIAFYELITITPDGESLVMRLKHFTADLTGWEAKEGSAALEFPLVERSDTRWKFGPVTFTQDGPNKLQVSVRIKQDDGTIGSLDFNYDRVLPDG